MMLYKRQEGPGLLTKMVIHFSYIISGVLQCYIYIYILKSRQCNNLLKINSLLDWFGLFWFGFMAHQPLEVITAKSILKNINSSISNNSV